MKPASQKSATISVLYVEDDKQARDITLSMLESRYSEQCFHTADNGLQGLKRFRKQLPQIVLTDISMPGMNGITMAASIKELAPQTIIIAVTSHSETDNLLKAIEIGINQYILKPIDFVQLCSVIDQSIANVRKEQQLREQNEQIRTLNSELLVRTQDLEAFNYTVAHDLRSPLNCIGGFSQFLLNKLETSLDDKSIECLQIIRKETLRMNGLIEALLKFSTYTRKSIEKQWTDFSSIANDIKCNLLLREPQRQVACSIADNIKGYADPILIGIVLENLLGNAWKYTANNYDTCIEFGTTTIEEDIVYYVRDNGVGFDQQEAEILFAPFQRLQSNAGFEGFGIGLATAGRIIQRHGGKIWAEGEKGRGATFYFSL